MAQYLVELDGEGVHQMAQGISKMDSETLLDSIQNIEKLYMKLMIEYNYELQRASNLGVMSKGAQICRRKELEKRERERQRASRPEISGFSASRMSFGQPGSGEEDQKAIEEQIKENIPTGAHLG